ncbi:MAG: ATP-binding protein [Actinomycetota bacterium]
MTEVLVLGPIAVRLDGTEVPVTSPTQRRILAALVSAAGAAVPAGALESLVWGDQPPENARASLKSHVSRLRRILGADVVAARPPGYALTLPPEQVDAHRFEKASEAHSLEEIEQLLRLWRGPPFGELADHPYFASTVTRLRELHTQARSRHAGLLGASGEHQRAAAQWRALAEEQPLLEPVWIGLMDALHTAGRQADAVAAAARYRGEVAAVGLEPSTAFTEAERRIFASAPAGRRPAAATATLPAAPTRLLGRDRELASIRDLVPRQRLVTIVGPAGVGKTRLAQEVGGNAGDLLPDGTWLAHLTEVEAGGSIVPTVVRAVGAPTTPPLDRSLEKYLAHRRSLLVLDNAEHVLAAVRALVQQLLAATDRLHVLTTSRQALGIPGEVLVPVEPLDPEAALRLFRERALDGGVAVGDEDQIATHVCARLDRLPLAIEMAAGRLRALGLQDLADRLDERLHLLSSTAGAQTRTLEEVIRWSYDLLDPAQRTLLDQLSVFAGHFGLDSAEAVTDVPHTAGVLADLVERSLVQADTSAGRARYRLLETVRTFANAQLAASDVHEPTLHRYVQHHVDLAERIQTGLRSADEDTWMALLDARTADLEAALATAVSDDDVDAACRIAAAPHIAVYQHLRADLGAWAEEVVELARRHRHSKAPVIAATAALNRLNQGDLDAAITLLADLPDHPDARHGHEVLGELHVYCGDLDRGIAEFLRAEALAEEAADEFTRLNARISRAIALGYAHAEHPARELIDDVRRSASTAGLRLIEAWCDYAAGELLADTDPEQALELVERSLRTADPAGWRMLAGAARLTASSLRARTADPTDAVSGFRQLIEHWRDMGDHTHQWTTMRNLIDLLTRLGEDEPAARLIGTVTHQAPVPTFGAEEARLSQAMATLQTRLGARADELMRAGRDDDLPAALDLALIGLRRNDDLQG